MFRLIAESVERRPVGDASEPGAVVGVCECGDEAGAVGVGFEPVLSGVGGGVRLLADRLGRAAVEAFGHAAGLWRDGSGAPVLDAMGGADPVEGVLAGAGCAPAPARVSEAVGERRPVVRQDDPYGPGMGGEKAREAGRDGWAGASGGGRSRHAVPPGAAVDRAA
ncbi:MAG: hypothetical protein ACT4OK_18270 [Gemmobacter sp.]